MNPRSFPARSAVVAVAALFLLSFSGCSPGVDASYGRSRTGSINGTAVLAGMFRERRHEVRAAVRLTEELHDWADVIVRFATHPGPLSKDEAQWYAKWLDTRPGRRIVYVPYDYNAAPDYWTRAREQLPGNASERLRDRVDEALDEARKWPDRLPAPIKDKNKAGPEEWFAVKSSSPKSKKPPTRSPRVCTTLGGPWALGVAAEKAELVRDDTLKAASEHVFLTGDGEPLVISWTRRNDSRVLVVASGTFFLNAALATHPARWPLAWRVVDWASFVGDEDEGEAGTPAPKRVAFVEGAYVTAKRAGEPSIFDVLANLRPFLVVTVQGLVLGVAACLSMALMLRLPQREEPSGADRPVAHPEALGALLARTTQAREARSILETYRRWRSGPASRGAAPPSRS
jgi:hypothetical protein